MSYLNCQSKITDYFFPTYVLTMPFVELPDVSSAFSPEKLIEEAGKILKSPAKSLSKKRVLKSPGQSPVKKRARILADLTNSDRKINPVKSLKVDFDKLKESTSNDSPEDFDSPGTFAMESPRASPISSGYEAVEFNPSIGVFAEELTVITKKMLDLIKSKQKYLDLLEIYCQSSSMYRLGQRTFSLSKYSLEDYNRFLDFVRSMGRKDVNLTREEFEELVDIYNKEKKEIGEILNQFAKEFIELVFGDFQKLKAEMEVQEFEKYGDKEPEKTLIKFGDTTFFQTQFPIERTFISSIDTFLRFAISKDTDLSVDYSYYAQAIHEASTLEEKHNLIMGLVAKANQSKMYVY